MVKFKTRRHLSDEAIKYLMPFASTYLCEKAFSTLTYIKNKYHTRLDVQNEMCLALTEIEPRITQLCATKLSY